MRPGSAIQHTQWWTTGRGVNFQPLLGGQYSAVADTAASSSFDEMARYEKIRKARFCRTWVDSEGAGHLEARMTADALGVLRANLGIFESEVFADARREGRRETRQAYLAD